jgi:hypothetical protein
VKLTNALFILIAFFIVGCTAPALPIISGEPQKNITPSVAENITDVNQPTTVEELLTELNMTNRTITVDGQEINISGLNINNFVSIEEPEAPEEPLPGPYFSDLSENQVYHCRTKSSLSAETLGETIQADIWITYNRSSNILQQKNDIIIYEIGGNVTKQSQLILSKADLQTQKTVTITYVKLENPGNCT